MKKLAVAFLIACAFAAYVYAAPYLALSSMRDAASARDAAKLSSYIDYASLRQSLSSEIQRQIAGDGKGPASLLRSFGSAFAAPLVEPMIDSLVTPESLALMMRGQRPAQNGASPPANPAAGTPPDVHMAYEGASVFVVTVSAADSKDYPFGFVLQRSGLLSWKLAAIRLPRLAF